MEVADISLSATFVQEGEKDETGKILRNHFGLVRARRAFVVFNAVANFCCHLHLLDTFPLPT